MNDIGSVVALIGAVAGLLSALGVFLGVLPKLGVHSDVLDTISADVRKLAAGAVAVEGDIKLVAPSIPVTGPSPPGTPAATAATEPAAPVV